MYTSSRCELSMTELCTHAQCGGLGTHAVLQESNTPRYVAYTSQLGGYVDCDGLGGPVGNCRCLPTKVHCSASSC